MVEFDQRLELPSVQGRFRFVTAVWGVGLVVEAVARTVLTVSLPTPTFLVVSLVLFWGVIGALMWFTVRYSRASEQQILKMIEATVGQGTGAAGRA